jgi:hypothetical protein
MLLHGGRPDQRILFCPAPGPPFAHQSIRAALMASKDMTDFMQGRCIGDRGPDRRDPNLMKFLAGVGVKHSPRGVVQKWFEGLLGGGPSPEQVQQAKDSAQASPPVPEPSPPYAGFVAPSNPRQTLDEYVEAERQCFAEERRQALLRDYGREVPPETERDAKIERDRGGGERER